MKRKTSYKRKKKQQPIFRNRSFWAGLSLAVLAASLSYLTVFSSWVQVRSVNVTGTNEVSKEAVLEMVEQRVQGTWLGFPTASIFLFGVKEAEQSLLD
ncbi:MAG: hypothetical protein Q8P12_03860, partial [bacterium]|nr:hypothetical protein [bacterium]